MTRSTSKKTLQTFHARNTIWELFSRYAKEMDCSVDFLINEAMRMYASNQGFIEKEVTAEEAAPAPPKPSVPKPKDPAPTIREKPSAKLPRPGARAGGSGSGPAPVPSAGSPKPSAGAPRATVPSLPRPGGTGSGISREATAPPVPRPSSPPPPAIAQDAPTPIPTGDPSRPSLTLIFQGRKIPIAQDQFIIGRGTKSADLPIKDANISRKHAAIIFHNGTYYMKDLGSTNGVDFNGNPVDSKRIDEGDVFSICGFDLHFTYNA